MLEALFGEQFEQRQGSPPPNPCFTYTESIFITNTRGVLVHVSEIVLRNGAACAQATANTMSEQLDASVEFGGGIEGIYLHSPYPIESRMPPYLLL